MKDTEHTEGGADFQVTEGAPSSEESNPELFEADRRIQELLEQDEAAECEIVIDMVHLVSSFVSRRTTYGELISSLTDESLHPYCISWPQRECDFCEAYDLMADAICNELRSRGLEAGVGVVRFEKGKPPQILID